MKLAPQNLEQLRDFTPQHKITVLWEYINSLVTRAKTDAALDKWSDQAWMTYYALKEPVLAGKDVELPDALPPCPVTFGQLLFE